MLPIDSLGLSANQWQFLSLPEKYVAASKERALVLESTRRQFLTARDILARLNGSFGLPPRRGALLADDVGLGKTTVAALVAWVVASAGERRGVRILAPNDVMMRRWEEELLSHVEPLQACAPALDVRASRVKARRVKLTPGTIQVVKHSYAAQDLRLACDLLIVDEAHRAKGDGTAFSVALKRQRKYARRVLILTATPFSIRLEELERMLTLVGGEAARGAVRSFSRALDDLYWGNTARTERVVADRLAGKARAAVDALASHVIRHGIDDLPDEHRAFGARLDWGVPVPPASSEELELMLRMDRMLRVAKEGGKGPAGATNDPRFHVGWRHLDAVTKNTRADEMPAPASAIVRHQLACIRRLRGTVGTHSKIAAVAAAVNSKLALDEKVLLFCHHHATAQELTVHLASAVPTLKISRAPAVPVWKRAWDSVLQPMDAEQDHASLRSTFIDWLASDLFRTQVVRWIGRAGLSQAELERALRATPARHAANPETIAGAAQRLYHAMLLSRSSRAVLKAAADRLELLPGAGGSRVLGVCPPTGVRAETALFTHNQQPDTVISTFNSPFGPDVLVVTDKLSEGIDLHRYCRHLIHYELDPSPIRTVQRNGRLRRVNSWAAATGQPICYAYPAFGGTRDHRLVQIMKKRIDSFSLLLGGVQDFDVDEVVGGEERWRNQVIALAKQRLRSSAGTLRARDP